MSSSTLASFTVNQENWKRFKKLASSQGRSASNCLNQLIEQALYKNDINIIDSDKDYIKFGEDYEDYINSLNLVNHQELNNELSKLQSQIERLTQRLDEILTVDKEIVLEQPKSQPQTKSIRIRNEATRRQKVMELMGHIPTCPVCGTESLSKEGHGKSENSYKFRCVNKDCSRKTFTVHSSNP